jgi:hypothetical protein
MAYALVYVSSLLVASVRVLARALRGPAWLSSRARCWWPGSERRESREKQRSGKGKKEEGERWKRGKEGDPTGSVREGCLASLPRSPSLRPSVRVPWADSHNWHGHIGDAAGDTHECKEETHRGDGQHGH